MTRNYSRTIPDDVTLKEDAHSVIWGAESQQHLLIPAVG